MTSNRPILVTGAHRSGTTWVGRIITACPTIVYIHEPFNIRHDIGICGARFDYWFTYVSEQNEQDFYRHIKKTINFRYNLAGKLKTIRTPRDLHNTIKEYIRLLKYRFSYVRPLLKDPIAIFSAEWLASRFDADVAVLIRHPAAFAGSLKVKNWTHPFSHFLKQPLLMKDHLYPFEAEIKKFAEEGHDIIDQAILLWRLIHYMIKKFKEKHHDWIFIRHEDLSRDPLNGFRTLFSKLDLDFSQHVVDVIKWHSSHSDSTHLGADDRFISLQRDSISNIRAWETRLTDTEVERIKTQVQDISKEFYSEPDW